MSKWEMVRLGDVGTVITGNTPKTSDEKNYSSNDLDFFKPGDMAEGAISVLTAAQSHVSNHARSQCRLIPPRSVLVTCIGIIGKIGITTNESTCNQQINAIISDETICSSRFLAYAISRVKPEMNHIANAAVVPILNKSQFSNIQIPLPPLPTQQKIADILDRAGTLIEKRKAQIAKLDLLVKSQFVEMFGDPVVNPMGWDMQTIGSCVTFQGGSQPPKSVFTYKPQEGCIRLIQIRDYKSNRFVTYIPQSMARKFCQIDDIMIGRYGPPLFQVLRGLEGAYNVALMKAVPNGVDKEYLRFYLSRDELLRYLEGFSQRTAGQDGVDMEMLKRYPFPIPPHELQTRFADFVRAVYKTKAEMQRGLDKLELLYKSLMQKCFAGELF